MDGVTGVRLEGEGCDPNAPDPPCVPEPGDASLCCYCATFITYQEESDGFLSLRVMNRADLARAKADPDKWNALSKMKEIVETVIDRARVMGDKRYAGKIKKFVV